ncbi:putative triacylglycerol lipase [Aspergillus ruber CBS 135680]|uniref:Carboxylic ester hydrolase n=1 Tax=Aspergillus ruber (strain CBS 135680) TaxID=1388766 RepID=A0A017SHZ8_ASPRC|nr:alpha/beta-hydrolase [Aspergillus ruber CBS 135680]EYE95935.1 alpha/beta-hydrolase [Aspergillus ruber CBS 135680]
MLFSGRFFAIFFVFSVVSALDTVVDLGYAKYRGQSPSNSTVEWLGIQFAAPPVGDLRFAAPQDPVKKDGIQSANQHGPICIPTELYPIPSGRSEDCLYLDVYAPAQTGNSSKLPVFVWIQGGGFNSLAGPNYNGTGLIKAADNGIVVVTINYRVGPYGFLAGEEIKKGGSINNGLKDQIKALEWVQKHISKFGGDPQHVVLGGASAGAASINLLLGAYGGRNDGLFHGAAIDASSFASMRNVEQSQFTYNNLVTRTGCASKNDTLACLRNLDIADLQRENINTPLPNAQNAPLYMYGPTVDNDLIPDLTYRLFHQGHFIKVPVIFGDVTNEGTTFVPKNTSDVGDADTFIQSQFPQVKLEHLAKINELYLQPNQTQDFPNSGPYWRPASNAYGDIRYTCPGMDMSTVFAKAGAPSWSYKYDVQDPDTVKSGVGVPHTVDINAVFGPDYISGDAPASYRTSNAPIVPVVQGYWTSFIRSLDPNKHRHSRSPEWKGWDSGKGHQRLYIRTGQTKMETVSTSQREKCDYLVSIGEALWQ